MNNIIFATENGNPATKSFGCQNEAAKMAIAEIQKVSAEYGVETLLKTDNDSVFIEFQNIEDVFPRPPYKIGMPKTKKMLFFNDIANIIEKHRPA